MRLRAAMLLAVTVSLSDASFISRPAPPVLVPNDNTKPAGKTRDGVTTIELDAVPASWHIQGGASSIKFTDAFAERGKAPTMPGPLVRVNAGATVHFNVRNRLARPLTFYVPTSAATVDSIVVPPGATDTGWGGLAACGAYFRFKHLLPRFIRSNLKPEATLESHSC